MVQIPSYGFSYENYEDVKLHLYIYLYVCIYIVYHTKNQTEPISYFILINIHNFYIDLKVYKLWSTRRDIYLFKKNLKTKRISSVRFAKLQGINKLTLRSEI